MIIIAAEHPAWKALDDDDWCGATLSNYLSTVAKNPQNVVLVPPKGWSEDDIRRMADCFVGIGCTVTIAIES